jgi:hypothetical protein
MIYPERFYPIDFTQGDLPRFLFRYCCVLIP